jgi:hypothetical protein
MGRFQYINYLDYVESRRDDYVSLMQSSSSTTTPPPPPLPATKTTITT